MGHHINLRQGQTDWEVFQEIAREWEDEAEWTEEQEEIELEDIVFGDGE